MNQNLGDLDVAEMPLHKDVASAAEASPTNVPAPGELAQHDNPHVKQHVIGRGLNIMPTTTKNLILIKLADEIRSMSTDEPSALDLERRIEAD